MCPIRQRNFWQKMPGQQKKNKTKKKKKGNKHMKSRTYIGCIATATLACFVAIPTPAMAQAAKVVSKAGKAAKKVIAKKLKPVVPKVPVQQLSPQIPGPYYNPSAVLPYGAMRAASAFCTTCGGMGGVGCAFCGGNGGGMVTIPTCYGPFQQYQQCPWCNGRGRVPCASCGGKGWR